MWPYCFWVIPTSAVIILSGILTESIAFDFQQGLVEKVLVPCSTLLPCIQVTPSFIYIFPFLNHAGNLSQLHDRRGRSSAMMVVCKSADTLKRCTYHKESSRPSAEPAGLAVIIRIVQFEVVINLTPDEVCDSIQVLDAPCSIAVASCLLQIA